MENTIGQYKVSAIDNGDGSTTIRAEDTENKLTYERKFGPEDITEYRRFGGMGFIIHLIMSSVNKISIIRFTHEIWLETSVLIEQQNTLCMIKNIRIELQLVGPSTLPKRETLLENKIAALEEKIVLLEKKIHLLEEIQKKEEKPTVIGWRPPTNISGSSVFDGKDRHTMC